MVRAKSHNGLVKCPLGPLSDIRKEGADEFLAPAADIHKGNGKLQATMPIPRELAIPSDLWMHAKSVVELLESTSFCSCCNSPSEKTLLF